jgi:TPR repeat protein
VYSEGLGVNADYAEAAKWYTLAARQGVIAAQFTLGVMYAQGLGVAANHAQSARWYDKAARQGDSDAQFALGLLHSQGVGVKRDQALAVEWFKQAAIGGLAVAQASLGLMYQLGQGVPQDDVCAYGWFNLAAANGSDRAQQKRDALRKQMTLEQVDRAQALGRTLAKTGMCESPTNTPAVSATLTEQVREQLQRLGYDSGPNGIEARTSSAVMAFQRDLGLSPTGNISEELLMLLRAREN